METVEQAKPLGTVLYKRFDHDSDAFDVFVMTRRGWVLVDQEGAASYAARPIRGWMSGYTEVNVLPVKVSEAS